MAASRHRRPDERDDEEERASEEDRPLDSGTIQSLREADPRDRAQAILRLQRLHGNAAVQRVIRSLQVTDASRDARVQMIGDRAEEPVPSGRLEKAGLYREAIEAELDAAPLAAKSERDLMQDNVNTIGQIVANYQAALHQFEAAVEDGVGETDVHPAESPREPGASAPAFALRNLLVAERRRIAATQMRLLKSQVAFADAAAERATSGGGDAYRKRLLGANMDLNELEATTHSA